MTQENRYSNRKVEGLNTPDEFMINNLSEYIEFFSSGELTNYLFRGEPTNYNETVSSALRDITIPGYNPKQGVKNENTFLNMQKDFKREVWYKLTPDERTHFSAFSQHHGIPTNLIDITTSPLVSLYFACQDYKNPKDQNEFQFDEQRGFVYLFKDQFVDITNVLTKFEDANILEVFASDKDDVFLDIYNLFLKFKAEHPEVYYEYFQKLYIDFHKRFENFPAFIPMMNLNEFPAYDEGRYETKFFEYFMALLESSRFNKFFTKIQDDSYSVFIYTAHLQILLQNIHSMPNQGTLLNILPHFKYAPILTFERGRSQQGLFVYQNYIQDGKFLNTPYIVSVQRIWPDKILIINDKINILNQLDFIGINEKFIYGDYDNIAKYIKRRSQ